MTKRLTILFLCTGNSCRSQMAEGWARHLKAGVINAYSAGIVAKGLDPRAATVMTEAGVDISGQQSKTLDDLADVSFDYVITLCGHAHETCPVFPGAKTIHIGFPDPPAMATEYEEEEAKLGCYRRVRDAIRRFVEDLPGAVEAGSSTPTV